MAILGLARARDLDLDVRKSLAFQVRNLDLECRAVPLTRVNGDRDDIRIARPVVKTETPADRDAAGRNGGAQASDSPGSGGRAA